MDALPGGVFHVLLCTSELQAQIEQDQHVRKLAEGELSTLSGAFIVVFCLTLMTLAAMIP